MKKLIYVLIYFSYSYSFSQQSNDCENAIVVCGNTTILSNSSGFGIQELDRETNSCGSEEVNSLWLRIRIATGGSLAFNLSPDNVDIEVDYDFFIFGPDNDCGNFDDPIRCSTTNPVQANLNNNFTGLRDSEIDQNEGPGELGNSYVSSIPVYAGEQYYILINRPIGNGGFILEWTGSAKFFPPPTVNQPLDLIICPYQENLLLDLTEQESTITNSTSVVISYFTNYEDAFANQNSIVNPTQFVYNGYFTPIFIRVANPNDCFEVVTFSISTLEFANPPNLDYVQCDGNRDNLGEFSTVDIITDIENSLKDANNFQVSLYADESNALANSNQLTGSVITVPSSNIYARISSVSLTACYIAFPISLEVTATEFPATINLLPCDIDQENSLDSLTSVDLEQAFPFTYGATILFYETYAKRENNIPIENPNDYFTTTTFNTVIFYKILSESCESLGELTILGNTTTENLNTIRSIQTCDGNSEDEILESTFDLESIKQTNFSGLEITFYETLQNAELEQNLLHGNYRTNSTTIYARLENNNQCVKIERIKLIVNPIPKLSIETDYYLCTDGEPITIEGPIGFDKYKWFEVDVDHIIEIGDEPQIIIPNSGNYRLEVGTQYDNNANILNCSTSADFIVAPSNRATFQNIEILQPYNVSSIIINVFGEGDYEYSMNGETYQDQPRFDAIENGFYSVFVRDKNGCGVSKDDFSIVGFPKFFSPNGDGANDVWQIIKTNANLNNKMIRIFDRYGKLIKQLKTNEIGWDGTYNGKVLPSSEYWFSIMLDNGKEFKSHFSLIR